MRITDLGDKIKFLRKKKHLGQKKLANDLKVGQATISQWEHNRQEPNPTQRKKLCKYFNITEADLFDKFEIKNLNSEVIPVARIPIISWSHANAFNQDKDFFNSNGSIEEWIHTPYQGSKWVFALRIRDSAMEPEFNLGDILVVDPESHPRHNDYVLVRSSGSPSATFRQLKKIHNITLLHALNPKYPDYEIKGFDKHFQIIGKIVVKNKMY